MLFAVCHEQQPLHAGGGVLLSGLFFLLSMSAFISEEKITD